MQFPFLLAILAALVLAENCPPEPADAVLLRAGLTLVAVAVVVAVAFLIAAVTALRMRRRPGEADRMLVISNRWRHLHTWLWIVAVVTISLGLGWPRIVRFNWGFDGAFLADELLILLPVLLPLVLSWAAFYGIERASYQTRAAAGLVTIRPAPSLGHTMSLHARHYLGVMLLPILFLTAVQDAVALWLPAALAGAWSVAIYAAPILLLVAFFPVFLRRLWKTRPLEPCELRDRLTALSARAGLKIREILVWETRGSVVNAAVSGWLPGCRYVFLTDGLIARLTGEEIEAVFGHELGHIRRRHLLLRGLVMVAPLSLLMGLELAWPDSARWMEAIANRFNAAAQMPLAVGTLVVLSSYAYFVFGGFCRILEKEADLYGCSMLLAETPDHACRVFISALEKLNAE
ncbi:MAG: M48 family metalloprotease, partial [Thermoguttaceae bacterium]